MGEKIECVKAGLHSPQLTGQRLAVLDRASLGQPLGRMFAITGRGTALLAVNGLGSISPRGLTIDMGSAPRVVDTWESNSSTRTTWPCPEEGTPSMWPKLDQIKSPSLRSSFPKKISFNSTFGNSNNWQRYFEIFSVPV